MKKKGRHSKTKRSKNFIPHISRYKRHMGREHSNITTLSSGGEEITKRPGHLRSILDVMGLELKYGCDLNK